MYLAVLVSPASWCFNAPVEGSVGTQDNPISFATLLAEMTDRRANCEFPAPYYRAAQMSSYDRRSVAPGKDGWFRNDDGRGFIRTEENNGRTEKVLFDEKGPGAVTRLWITTDNKRGTLRFYFDGEKEARVVIPGYDLNKFPLHIGEGLMFNHTNYSPIIDDKGGNTCYLPMPYAKSLKITLEDNDPQQDMLKYYHVGFRKYDEGIAVKTFSLKEMEENRQLLEQVNDCLLNPQTYANGKRTKSEVKDGSTLSFKQRNAAIYGINLQLSEKSQQHYSDVMNNTTIQIFFDGKLCVDAPLCDFLAGGTGAPKLKGWYTDCDGKKNMRCRWIMPFKRKAEVRFVCNDGTPFAADVEIITNKYRRSNNTLYFHATGHADNDLTISEAYHTLEIAEWNLATIDGRGIYVGDVLSVNNKLRNWASENDERHWIDWYGEGDEHIWIDNEQFPSFFGTGTEDYYNCSWAAPIPTMLNPYGGVPRVDELEYNHGYMTWLRTRMLDAIPFSRHFRFDFELAGHNGLVDYRTTYCWYGDQ